MTSALFFFFTTHPVAHSVCLFLLQPDLPEAIPLLFAWRQSHASRCFFMSCFWTENTWTQRHGEFLIVSEQQVQLRRRERVQLLSTKEWGYILSIYSSNDRNSGLNKGLLILISYFLARCSRHQTGPSFQKWNDLLHITAVVDMYVCIYHQLSVNTSDQTKLWEVAFLLFTPQCYHALLICRTKSKQDPMKWSHYIVLELYFICFLEHKCQVTESI